MYSWICGKRRNKDDNTREFRSDSNIHNDNRLQSTHVTKVKDVLCIRLIVELELDGVIRRHPIRYRVKELGLISIKPKVFGSNHIGRIEIEGTRRDAQYQQSSTAFCV